MFVLVDALPLQTPTSRGRGIGRYAAGLLAALADARPDWDFRGLVHDYLPPPTLPRGMRTHAFAPPLPITPENRDANERVLADFVAALNPAWVLHPSVWEADGLVPRYAERRPRVGVVLYDLIPLLFPHVYLRDAATAGYYAQRTRVAAAADVLLAISESTAADARRLLGPDLPPVVNIRGAADPAHEPLAEPAFTVAEFDVRTRLGLPKPFVLFVGGFEPRKNMSGAVAGFAALPPELRANLDLVIACDGPPAHRDALLREAENLGVGCSVRLTGFVPDSDLRVLYQAARVVFFPTFYEGLGLPVAESLRYGTPVVAADNSAQREYGGPASWYCDPASPASMAASLAAALAEPRAAREAERIAFARTFTWDDTAERTAAVLEKFAAPARVPARPRKPRIAWVSPAPPSETGIADYALEVANVLSERFEIEWVTDPRGPAPTAAVAARYRCVSAAEFDARHAARPFDLPVYHIGNNHFHAYALGLMRRHPGLVVVHDVHLGGLFRTAADRGVWPADFPGELEHNGEWLLADWVRRGLVHPHAAPTLNAMNRRVLDGAAALVMHSAHGWQLARKATDAPVSVVPLFAEVPPNPPDPVAERRRLRLPADRFIVCSLGLVGSPKRLDVLIRAAGGLPADVKARVLVLSIGPCGDDVRADLLALAESVGLAGQVEIRGKAPLADFAAYAVAADANVQLRFPSNGETSAALYRALAAGAACVISDTGAMAELPNDVALKVRSPARDEADLTAALVRLAREPGLRDRLGKSAREFVATTCDRRSVPAGYAAAIENARAVLAADGEWRTAAANALAELPPETANGLLSEWAELRGRVGRTAGEPLSAEPRREAA